MGIKEKHLGAALAAMAALAATFASGIALGVVSTTSYSSTYPQFGNSPEPRSADGQPSGHSSDNRDAGALVPCEAQRNTADSTLCAQWRATQAAEDSSFWAKWSFALSIIGAALSGAGILALLATIRQNRTAIKQAKRANRISQQSTEAELRPWISMEPDLLQPIHSAESFRFNVSVTVTNNGMIPAQSVDIHVNSIAIPPYGEAVIFNPVDYRDIVDGILRDHLRQDKRGHPLFSGKPRQTKLYQDLSIGNSIRPIGDENGFVVCCIISAVYRSPTWPIGKYAQTSSVFIISEIGKGARMPTIEGISAERLTLGLIEISELGRMT